MFFVTRRCGGNDGQAAASSLSASCVEASGSGALGGGAHADVVESSAGGGARSDVVEVTTDEQ
jgi:hypothetical protein